MEQQCAGGIALGQLPAMEASTAVETGHKLSVALRGTAPLMAPSPLGLPGFRAIVPVVTAVSFAIATAQTQHHSTEGQIVMEQEMITRHASLGHARLMGTTVHGESGQHAQLPVATVLR